MPRVLYNEGRVVGYSAYEIYVKNHKAVDPNSTPASEREWLASSLAMGSSLLLRVGSDSTSGAHYRDITFPEGSSLSAANVIFASCFIGAGEIGTATSSDNVWCTKVVDYGSLISNTSELSPSSTTVPTKQDISIDNNTKNQFLSYANIIDGIVIQPGTWIESTNKPPEKSLQPNLSELPILRLSFSDTVETPFFLLLTGFTNKGVLVGSTSVLPSGSSSSPQDGDFLGPAVFPWSAKIIFSIPPYAMTLVSGDYTDFNYERKFGEGASALVVDSNPIIDFQSCNPSASHESIYDISSIKVDVTNIETHKQNASVLAAYNVSYMDERYNVHFFNPSLYGATVSGTGEVNFYPLDSYAPDTIHMYQINDTYDAYQRAKQIEESYKCARAFVRDKDDYTIHEYSSETDEFVPVAKTIKTSLFSALVSEPIINPIFYVQGDLRNGITQKWNGSDYPTHIGGTDTEVKHDDMRPDVGDGDPSLWYLQVDESIASEYNLRSIEIITGPNPEDRETVQGIPGTEASQDYLMYTHVGCLVYRRLTGKFSNAIKEQCGYTDIFDSSGNPIGPFGAGGIWDSTSSGKPNIISLFSDQIPNEDKHKYYGLFAVSHVNGLADNTPAYPVKEDDNYVDVTFKNIFFIHVNGTRWNIPHFENLTRTGFNRGSMYLGSWWNASPDPDNLTASRYTNKWARIDTPTILHPTVYSAVLSRYQGQTPGQIYQWKAMLPTPDLYYKKMSWLFGSSLDNSGIKDEFKELTVLEFLRMAMYTDMGTGKTLSSSNDNVRMSTDIYTNGYNDDTETYSKNDMHVLLNLSMKNSADTVSSAQFLTIPDEYLDPISDDPVGVITKTGRQQALSLSMTDGNNMMYNFYGTSGDIDTRDVGKITWHTLLEALSKNKSLNVLGEILTGIAANISGSGKNYIEFADGSNSPIRIYVSRTEPSDNDVPEGSVGLGWGTGVHTYTSGAWSQ